MWNFLYFLYSSFIWVFFFRKKILRNILLQKLNWIYIEYIYIYIYLLNGNFSPSFVMEFAIAILRKIWMVVSRNTTTDRPIVRPHISPIEMILNSVSILLIKIFVLIRKNRWNEIDKIKLNFIRSFFEVIAIIEFYQFQTSCFPFFFGSFYFLFKNF